MESVIRAVSVYIFLLILIRFSGRRTMGQMTSFDFILLLIISEAASTGLTGEDNSITNSIIVISTLILIDIIFSIFKSKWSVFDKAIDGVPTVLIYDGKIQKENIARSRTDLEDILDTARADKGLEKLEQIKYAILEKNGHISIIPYEQNVSA
ncbi:MAG: hypothetical protein BWY69_00457 [Planctomycetes bacterium ADurb.Bin401]|nr:MAG: hypothetical protein BWY69_00457 [Planctomycetes bacterium ADurb.Bin401]